MLYKCIVLPCSFIAKSYSIDKNLSISLPGFSGLFSDIFRFHDILCPIRKSKPGETSNTLASPGCIIIILLLSVPLIM